MGLQSGVPLELDDAGPRSVSSPSRRRESRCPFNHYEFIATVLSPGEKTKYTSGRGFDSPLAWPKARVQTAKPSERSATHGGAIDRETPEASVFRVQV